MERQNIYCDHSATTPPAPEVLEEMHRISAEIWGNPSSIHQTGQAAKVELEKAREILAGTLNASRNEIIFTSGGTEADNFALRGIAHALCDRGDHIITSRVEHEAVLNTCADLEHEGFRITYLDVDQHGMVPPESVTEAIEDSTILISIMHANNEIGTINPIGEIGALAHEYGVVFHTDAVQSYGKLPVDVREMNIDALSVSGHKIYGPKGIGMLYLSKRIDARPVLTGGSQERHLRAGTENLPAIAGLAEAAKLVTHSRDEENASLVSMQRQLEEEITSRISGSMVHGHPENRLPGITNIGFQGIDSESLVMNLDMRGIAVSSGSACSSGTVKPSHVLEALGFEEADAKSAIRISLGRTNTPDQISEILDVLVEEIGRLRGAARKRNPNPEPSVSV